MDVGQVCMKTMGRETGEACIVLEKIDDSFVTIAGPRVKKRRCNVAHLEATGNNLKIKANASREDAIDALVKAKIVVKADVKKFNPPKELKPQKPVEKKEEKPKKEKKTLLKKKEKKE